MLIIYTGPGKGKTSASVGQTLRALGHELRVAFGQFMKKDVQAGEQIMLARLLGDGFHMGGSGFFRHENERPRHRAAAMGTLEWARRQLPGVDMLVLDEALYALGCGLILQEELQELVDACGGQGVHLVLSGRGLPDWLEQQADIVTEMTVIKHAMQAGINAARGIEF